ncbi:MAG TPA: diguanylate cyclase [Anaerolineaceae bacterium]|nr:diguanylate cyclase [Anaerolineaceae bacterium]
METDHLRKLELQLNTANEGPDRINALNALAWELRVNDPIRSASLAEQALELSRQQETDGHPYPQGIAQTQIILGRLAISSGSFGLALTRLLEAYKLLQELSAPVLLMEATHAIGWAHNSLGNYAESFDFLSKALNISRELENHQKEADILTSLGTVYSAEGHHAQAIEAFQRALELQEGQEISRARGVTLNNLALTQILANLKDDALDNALAGLKIAYEINQPSLQASILDTLGQVYLARGDLQQAEETLYKCLEIAKTEGLEHTEMEAMVNLGQVYYRQGRLEQTRKQNDATLKLAHQRQLNVYRYKSHEMLAKLYEEQGDYKNSLQHYKEFHATMEQALAESTNYRLDNLKILHKVETSRKEAEILKLQNNALEQEINEHVRDQLELEKLATIDPLTGLINRGHFFTLGEYEFEKARQLQTLFSIILLDIDHFKLINDTYNHSTGDRVLIVLAKLLINHARKGDIVCRYGGEEFVILLPNSNLTASLDVAERLRQEFSNYPIELGQNLIKITSSFGVAQVLMEDADLAAVLARADHGLYRAKSGGRNRVSV